MVLSVVFILLTLLVYAVVPKLRNLNGKCLMCYLAALSIGFILTAWMKLSGWHHVHPAVCYFIAYLMYFSLISAFSWLNVLNFDLWLSFQLIFSYNNRYFMNFQSVNSLTSINYFNKLYSKYGILYRLTSGFKKLSEQQQFYWYALFGCGFSTLLTFAMYVFDHIKSIPEHLQPGIGMGVCFIQSETCYYLIN